METKCKRNVEVELILFASMNGNTWSYIGINMFLQSFSVKRKDTVPH